MEQIELPLTWFEKLEAMKIMECLPVDNSASVYSAINANFKDSHKQFTVRTPKGGDKTYVWRIHDKPTNTTC